MTTVPALHDLSRDLPGTREPAVLGMDAYA